MENKINIAEILKNCEKGMELDCILFKDTPAYFHGVITETNYPIEIKVEYPSKELETFFLNKYGAIYDRPTAKCVIFPKGKTTWEGFVPPCKFKTGDVLFVDCSDDEDKSYQYIFILNDPEFYGKWHSYCHLDGVGCFHSEETYLTDEEYHPRFATEEEKAKLFDAIKANGYKWNAETKTLENLVEPKLYSHPNICEEDMSDLKKCGTATIKYIQENGSRDMELIVPYNQEIVNIDGRYILRDKKPQYPKTYEECCKILGIEDRENGYCGYEYELLGEFQKLYICRNAYWKIAGDWRPEFRFGKKKYCIMTKDNKVISATVEETNRIFVFSTEKMRDAFYDNFKDLIDSCKELL